MNGFGQYDSIEEVQRAFRIAERDCIADFGQEVWDNGGWHTVATNLAGLCTPDVAREFKRREGML